MLGKRSSLDQIVVYLKEQKVQDFLQRIKRCSQLLDIDHFTSRLRSQTTFPPHSTKAARAVGPSLGRLETNVHLGYAAFCSLITFVRA